MADPHAHPGPKKWPQRARGAKTRETGPSRFRLATFSARQAALGRAHPVLTCGSCGAHEAPARFGDVATARRLTRAGLCWTCEAWARIARARDRDPWGIVVASGVAVQLGPVGGGILVEAIDGTARFPVRWASALGEVPAHLRPLFPDTVTIGRAPAAVALAEEPPTPGFWDLIDAIEAR